MEGKIKKEFEKFDTHYEELEVRPYNAAYDYFKAGFKAGNESLPTYEVMCKMNHLINDFYITNEQWINGVYAQEELTTEEMYDIVEMAKYEFLKSHWED